VNVVIADPETKGHCADSHLGEVWHFVNLLYCPLNYAQTLRLWHATTVVFHHLVGMCRAHAVVSCRDVMSQVEFELNRANGCLAPPESDAVQHDVHAATPLTWNSLLPSVLNCDSLSVLSNPDLKLICFLLLSVNYSTYLFRQRLCSCLTALRHFINFVLLLATPDHRPWRVTSTDSRPHRRQRWLPTECIQNTLTEILYQRCYIPFTLK